MEKDDKALVVVGVQHIATKNHLTVRVRVYFRRFDGELFFEDFDANVWDLQHLSMTNKVKEGEDLGILGVPS